jgi:CheY-like chemotaxis protein
LTARCILIVDSDLVALNDVAACMRRMFEECQVVAATNGPVAMGRLMERPFDVALVSYDLPGMNGLDLAQLVHRSSPRTRIVLMTDRSSRIELRDEPSALLLRGHVRKPLGIGQIWGIVQASL